MAVCPNCNQRGKIYGPPGTLKVNAYWKECPSCHGTGEVQGHWCKCDRCKGWGEVGYVFISPDPCPQCNGRGIVPDKASGESAKKRSGPSIRIEFD